MGKEVEVGEGTVEQEQEEDGQRKWQNMIKTVIGMACEQPGGLSLPVGMRAQRRTDEILVFGPGSLTEVKVLPDMMFILIMKGARYWLQSKESNRAVLMDIQDYANSPVEPFEFRVGISFSATLPQTAQEAKKLVVA